MSLRTARFRLFKYRRSASKCFFRSYVFAECGHEDKRKSTSNIVCLCALQGSGYLSIGDLPVNTRKAESNIVCLCRLQGSGFMWSYVFADCSHEAKRRLKERHEVEVENMCHGVCIGLVEIYFLRNDIEVSGQVWCDMDGIEIYVLQSFRGNFFPWLCAKLQCDCLYLLHFQSKCGFVVCFSVD